MHRFATEFFPRAVAVNDLGLASYQNDNYVLDLWGLGSETARRLRKERKLDVPAMDSLIRNADVDFAMIYRSLFEEAIPDSWCLLATLEGERVSAAQARVYFYATRPSVVPAMNAALDRFEPTLPSRVTFRRTSCEGPYARVTH
jgi:hypothetical protein